MSANQTTHQTNSRRKGIWKGDYYRSGTALFYVMDIIGDKVMIENCYNNDVLCMSMDEWIKQGKEVVRLAEIRGY